MAEQSRESNSPLTVGVKFDEGKRDWTLLPWGPLDQVVRVLEFGARKYSVDNWQKVPDGRARYIRAALRHLIAAAGGEDRDPESGISHLAHCVCCLLFALHFEKTPGGR